MVVYMLIAARCAAMQESIGRLENILRQPPSGTVDAGAIMMAGSDIPITTVVTTSTEWDIQGRAGRAHTRALGGKLPTPVPRPSVATSVAKKEAIAAAYSIAEEEDKMILIDSAEMEAYEHLLHTHLLIIVNSVNWSSVVDTL
jgi:hypothetical protein